MKHALAPGLLLLLVSCSSDSNSSTPAADAPLAVADAPGSAAVDAAVSVDAAAAEPDGSAVVGVVDAGPFNDANLSSPFDQNSCHMVVSGDVASGVSTQTSDFTGFTGDGTHVRLAYAAFNDAARAMDSEIGCEQSTVISTDDAGVRALDFDVGFALGIMGHLTDQTFPFHITQASPEVKFLTVQYLTSPGVGWGCSGFDATIDSATAGTPNGRGDIPYLIHGTFTATCADHMGGTNGTVTIAMTF